MAHPVHDLRRLLETRFPEALPLTHATTTTVSTGVEVLDEVLPGGGLPRGRLTTWVEGGGATAVLASACRKATARGERAAWVDAAGTIMGEAWTPGPALVRPRDGRAALEAAEVLLRSTGFALVVVSGARAVDTELVRLARVAREGGGALVVVAGRSSAAAVRVRSRIPPETIRWRTGPFGPAEVAEVTVRARVHALGHDARTEFILPVAHHAHRLSLEPALVDRRGAPERPR